MDHASPIEIDEAQEPSAERARWPWMRDETIHQREGKRRIKRGREGERERERVGRKNEKGT